jgi:hypothetical protein
MRRILFAAVGLAALLLISTVCDSRAAYAAAPQATSECDSPCLTNLMDQYVAALVKHDPTGLPLSSNLKFTENTATIAVGDGLWVGASEAPTTFKIYAADPVSHQIALLAMMKEFDKPVFVAFRLKVENGKITEAEHIVDRGEIRPGAAKNLVTPRLGLVQTVPESERVSRDEMFRIADSYFNSIEQSNGSVAPYADDCERHENGMQTTTNKAPQSSPMGAADSPMAKISMLGCAASMNTHGLMYITKIWPRRIIVFDEEKQLVFSFPMFVHRGNVRHIKISNVPGVDEIPLNFGPIDLQAAELFAVRGGKIHEIEAMGYLLPYNAKTGWE